MEHGSCIGLLSRVVVVVVIIILLCHLIERTFKKLMGGHVGSLRRRSRVLCTTYLSMRCFLNFKNSLGL
jgi:hypothetical protein